MSGRSEIVGTLDALESSLSALSLDAPTKEDVDLVAVRHDLVSLAENLSKESTNLALALRPPVSVDASKSCLSKIADYHRKVLFLCSSTRAVDTVWSKELRDSAERVAGTVKQCLPLWRRSAAASTTAADRKALLVTTGRIWDEALGLRDKLSQNEREAHAKVWSTQRELVQDALDEAIDEDDEATAKVLRLTVDVLDAAPLRIADQDLEKATAVIEKLSALADELLDGEEQVDLREPLTRLVDLFTNSTNDDDDNDNNNNSNDWQQRLSTAFD